MATKKPKTVKADKPLPQKWLEKIQRAQKVKDAWRDKFRVGRCYDYYEGQQNDNSETEYFIVNRIFSTLQAELPTLYSTDPEFYVKLATSYSTNPMDVVLWEKRAKVRQSMLNYLKRELALKQKARLSIFDAHFQFGILKIFYSADLVENPDKGKPVIIEGTELPIINEAGNPLLEPEAIPVNEAYKISRVHPDDFLVDADAGPLDDEVSWKAQRLKIPIDDLKEDKRYNKGAIDKVQPTEISGEAQKEKEARQKGMAIADKSEDEPDTAVLWEIYDLKKKQWLVVAEGLQDDFLVDPGPLPPGIERDPFMDLRFVMRDSSWWPIPLISQLLDSQKATNEVRTKMVTHRKRFNRKYEMYAPAFDDPEDSAAKLEQGEDGTVVLKNQPIPTITPIQDAPLDQMHIMELNLLRADFQEMAVGANQQGSGSGIDSATEAGIVENRTKIREGDKLSIVMEFVADAGRKLDQIVQANITKDQAVKVTGGPNGEYWELVKTSDYQEIDGEYEYTINVGATTPQLPEIERAQWIGFLGAIMQAPYLMQSRRLMVKSAEMFHIYDESLIDEIMQIGKQMMAVQAGPPGAAGSQPNLMAQNPVSAQGGMAAGISNIRGGQQ